MVGDKVWVLLPQVEWDKLRNTGSDKYVRGKIMKNLVVIRKKWESTGVSSHFISTMWDPNQQKLEFHHLSFGSTKEELVIYNILYIYCYTINI